MNENIISEDAIVVERTFDAPVDVIWQMWTQPEHFKHWYGPQGFTVPVVEIDVRVGGKRRICMESPDGSMKIWTTGEYMEVSPNNRLVYTDCPADEKGDPVLYEGQLLESVVTVVLEDLDGRTKMRMTHAGLPSNQGANEGWVQAFTKLADYIATVLKK